MARHWTTYKKYDANMSFASCHFFANDRTDQVAAICGECGWMDERTGMIDDAMIETIKAHFESHTNDNQEAAK